MARSYCRLRVSFYTSSSGQTLTFRSCLHTRHTQLLWPPNFKGHMSSSPRGSFSFFFLINVYGSRRNVSVLSTGCLSLAVQMPGARALRSTAQTGFFGFKHPCRNAGQKTRPQGNCTGCSGPSNHTGHAKRPRRPSVPREGRRRHRHLPASEPQC